MLKFLKTMATAAALAALSWQAASAQAIEKKDITIGLPLNTSTLLPIYVADAQGFFKEEGINVKIVAFKGGTDLVRGMVAGAVDIGVGAFSEALVGVETGQGVKIFYGGFNMAVFDWYSVPSIKTLEEAKGKRFGVSTFGSSTDFLTRYALKTKGIDPKSEVQIVQGGGSVPRLAAMEAGQLEVNIFATPEKFMAADRGFNLILQQKSIAPDFPFHCFYAREDFIKNDPNAIKAVLRGFAKAVRWSKANKEESVKLLAAKLGLEETYLNRGYDDFIDEIFEDGRLASEAGMKAFWDVGIMNGTYKQPMPVDKYWVGTFHDTYNEWKPK
ncbi:ABC transporter substrate-binding protein [Neorhizobium sp. LjRoot104]|uniref:ABC transporter substrate-binding protein n=1 Tax=Neorhizobium sp. LjRoot104 TaxID=3342254 RepID=UPI003ECF1361